MQAINKLTLLLPFAILRLAAAEYPAVVVDVHDGDTLTVLVRNSPSSSLVWSRLEVTTASKQKQEAAEPLVRNSPSSSLVWSRLEVTTASKQKQEAAEPLHEDRPIRIRLAGIDSPELNQPFGDHARGFTAGLALQTTVTVIEEKPDRYGRMVAWVILPGGRSLNQEIVAAGFAWWYRQSAPGDSTLRALESVASHNQRGLWASADPTPPWQWRSDGSHHARSARRDTGRSTSARGRSQRSAHDR